MNDEPLPFLAAVVGLLLIWSGITRKPVLATLAAIVRGEERPGAQGGYNPANPARDPNRPMPEQASEHPCFGGPQPDLVHPMTALQPWARLERRAAASIDRIQSQAGSMGITDWYRTCQQQEEGHRTKPNLVAAPSRSNMHTRGLAVDVNVNMMTDRHYQLMQQEGWVRTVMPKEPWHWEYHAPLQTRAPK